MSSIGERPSDFWTKGSSLYTNAFGYASAPGDREPLRIKGASWFGLESSPCYPGGASKGKIELGMEFLRTHGFNALRLPLAVDAVVEAFRGENVRCMAPDPGVFYTYNIEWMDLGYLDFIDRMVTTAGNNGILVMLDLHAMAAGVWPDTGVVGEGRQLLHEAWDALSQRYCDPVRYWNVFAADLKNEPHGMYWGPLGAAHQTTFPEFHYQSPPAPPPPPQCTDDTTWTDGEGDGCHAYELTSEFACGFPYPESCTRCCATCRGTPKCLHAVYDNGDQSHVGAGECKDDATFRNSQGHGCDVYRSPVNNALHCGAVGHEGTCQSCCFSCNGDALAPLCEDGGAQPSPAQQEHVQDPDYPWEERWDLLAKELGDRVHQQCPRWLIVVEGVGHCMKEGSHGCDKPSASGQDTSVPTWWGENLQAADDFPVHLDYPQKIVYSPHSYGPSVYPQPYFEASDFPNNMPPIWDLQWGYLSKTRRAPILLGEWGGRYEGKDKTWQDKMAAYLKDNQIAGNFYWCINPESGDTGGLLLSWPTHEGDSGKLLLLASLPTTVVPTTEERLRPPPPAPPSPPPKHTSPPPPLPLSSPWPSAPIGLSHLAAPHPPSASSSTIRSASRDAGDDEPALLLSGGQVVKLVVAVLLLGVVLALARRCQASLRSRRHAAVVTRHSGGMDVVASRHERGRAGATGLPHRVTKISKSRAMQHSQLREISPQLEEPEPEAELEDVYHQERKTDEEETHVL